MGVPLTAGLSLPYALLRHPSHVGGGGDVGHQFGLGRGFSTAATLAVILGLLMRQWVKQVVRTQLET
jgi:hypothetical protein